MSTLEKMLSALVNGEELEVVPRSRKELFLKNCVEGRGADGLPTPRSRVEVLLYALAQKMAGADNSTLVKLIDGTIENLVIPEGVTSVGSYAFYFSEKLVSVTMPSTLTSIGYGAFHNCAALTSIDIPAGVTEMRTNAFNGCTALTKITCRATTPPTIEASTFNKVPDTCPIYVPAEAVDAYKAAANWSARADYIQAIE